MLARIVSPVDTYDAMRSHRNYPRYDAEGQPLKGSGEFGHIDAMRIWGSCVNTFTPPPRCPKEPWTNRQ